MDSFRCLSSFLQVLGKFQHDFISQTRFLQKFLFYDTNTKTVPVTVLARPGLGVIEKSISYSANDAGGSGEYEKIIFRPEKGASPNGILDLKYGACSGFKGSIL